MSKERITYIFPQDLHNLQVDDNGNYLVPDGFEIYKVVDTRQEEILRLEQELAGMTEPTDEELIEEGRFHHQYYLIKEQINRLKDGNNL